MIYITPGIKNKMIDFFKFIYNRQLIYYKKEILKENPPWTDDACLSKYMYCNVYRENDKGSKYLIEKVIKNNNLSDESKVFNIILYRRFNIFGFFDNVMPVVKDPKLFDWKLYETHLDNKIASGQALFNSAYTITQMPFNANYRKGDKHVQILMSMKDISLSITSMTDAIKLRTLKESHELLNNIRLVGPFLAHQILVDLTYIPDFIKDDHNSFVDVGPGAARGIDVICNYLNNLSTYPAFCKLLFESQSIYFEYIKTRLELDWMKIYSKDSIVPGPYLSLSNIQNSLCEFHKYHKHQYDPKSRKRYYK